MVGILYFLLPCILVILDAGIVVDDDDVQPSDPGTSIPRKTTASMSTIGGTNGPLVVILLLVFFLVSIFTLRRDR